MLFALLKILKPKQIRQNSNGKIFSKRPKSKKALPVTGKASHWVSLQTRHTIMYDTQHCGAGFFHLLNSFGNT